jgi:hypothetical protein
MTRKLIVSAVVCCLPFLSIAQTLQYYPSNYIKATNNGIDTLQSAFAGGLAHPMFSNIDLNGDGLKDLVVFDRGSERVSCYLAKRAGAAKYEYSVKYSQAFPPAYGWMWLVDYDKDGRPDIFTMSSPDINSTGMSVYWNVTTVDSVPQFKLFKASLHSCFSTGDDNIVFNQVEIPAIADIDEDGDYDILTFAGEGNTVRYYKNLSQENHHSDDSLEFGLSEECWDKFYEYPGGTQNMDSLGYDCSEYLVCHKTEHAGSSVLAYDFDNDHDMELVVGDAGYSNVNYLINGRNPLSSKPLKIDSAVSIRYDFPFSTKLDIPNMPQPCLVDVDNNGTLDLVAGPADVSAAPDEDFTWYYSNVNNNKEPAFQLVSKHFLDDIMIDPASYSAPAFCDFNHDGLPDLMACVSSNPSLGAYNSRLYLYQNIGTKKKAFFKLYNDDYLSLSSKKLQQLKVCFGDLNGDGMEDLILGDYNGRVFYYANTGTSKLSSYTSSLDTLHYLANGKKYPINVGTTALPSVVDMDKDGKMDLLLGSGNGNLHYYHNISTGTTPLFELANDTFGGNQPLNDNKASPYIADLDKNGHPDLLLGGHNGEIGIFMDIDLAKGNITPLKNVVYNSFTKKNYEPDFGYAVAPAAALLDDDTLPDIVIGSYAGGFQLLTSGNHADIFTSVKPDAVQESHMRLYPNPASQSIFIEWDNGTLAADATFTVIDMTGRVSKQFTGKNNTGENNVRLDVSNLTSGIYLLRMEQEGAPPVNQRFVISK